MKLANPFKNLFSARKISEARIAASIQRVGEPALTNVNYEAFSAKGYGKNAVVYTVVNKLATSCSGIDWVLYQKGKGRKKNLKELENHPMLDLWSKPNPLQSTSMFVESVIGFLKISGNSYIEANKVGKDIRELWPVRPDKMKIIVGKNGYPSAYVFKYGQAERTWQVDPVKLISDICHMKTFNPTDDWYGQSPLQAALTSLDQYNAGQKWNIALLQNEARPSGVLQMKATDSNPRGALTDEQFDRLKGEIDEQYSGYTNAGRPMLLEGGLEWKQISLSPKDLDFLNLKNTTAQDIALIYGVPPEIVGLGTKTFANYKEARLAFYEETILPTMDSVRDYLNIWLTASYGDNLFFDYDKDSIDALIEKREQKYMSLQTTSFLKENEKRVAAGYEEVEGLDIFVIGGTIYHEEEFKTWMEEDNEPTPPTPSEEPTDKPTEDNDTTDSMDDSADGTDSGDDVPPSEGDTQDSEGKATPEFKAFNLLNQNEKRKSWQTQNKLRDALAREFKRDLVKDYSRLEKNLMKVAKQLNAVDNIVTEFALMTVVTDWVEKYLEDTLRLHTEKAVRRFGMAVIRDAKHQRLVRETKSTVSKFDSFVLSYIEERTGTQIKSITNTTEKQVRRIVKEWTAEAAISGDSIPELSKYIQAEFEGLPQSSATRIARTEIGAASSNGSLEATKALQIPTIVKEWISASDDRVRDDAGIADHRTVDANNGRIFLDEDFKVNPDILMKCPQAPDAPAEQVINCRCVLGYANIDTSGTV